MEAELKAMIARRLADVDEYKMTLAKLKKKSKNLDEEITGTKEQESKIKQELILAENDYKLEKSRVSELKR